MRSGMGSGVGGCKVQGAKHLSPNLQRGARECSCYKLLQEENGRRAGILLPFLLGQGLCLLPPSPVSCHMPVHTASQAIPLAAASVTHQLPEPGWALESVT